MLAHSLRLVLPRMTAPASRSFCATKESFAGCEPTSASDPAVVCMRSAVSMLSLISTGMPCSGPRAPFGFALLVERCGDGQGVRIQFDHAVYELARAGRWLRSAPCISASERLSSKFSGCDGCLQIGDGKFVKFGSVRLVAGLARRPPSRGRRPTPAAGRRRRCRCTVVCKNLRRDGTIGEHVLQVCARFDLLGSV